MSMVSNLVVGAILLVGALFFCLAEACAQNRHDYALHQAIVAAQPKVVAGVRDGDGDALAVIHRESMVELFLYKQKYKIPDTVAQNPCQRAYEELSFSALLLASYIQPNRRISGPIDRDRDGREADKWWGSHREAFAECERLLKLPQSPIVGPDNLTSIVPP